MMIVQQGSCRLFELYAWNPMSATSGWSALVTWNLSKNDQLPDGWGSTTAAGTPLLPGVIWYDEVAAGKIEHAVDIVIPGAAIAKYEYVKPAARSGGACGSNYPVDGFPYGGRLRLKAGYDTSSFTGSQALVVIAALQKYGMLNTDASGETRSSFRLGDGNKLDQADLAQLSKLTWDDFEVPVMAVVQSKACN
jgi:predicted Zn-dependent protease